MACVFVAAPPVAAAHSSLGWNLLFLGEFIQTQAHLEQVIAGVSKSWGSVRRLSNVEAKLRVY